MSECRVLLVASRLVADHLPILAREYPWGRCRLVDRSELQGESSYLAEKNHLLSVGENYGIYSGVFGPLKETPFWRGKQVRSENRNGRMGVAGCHVTRQDFSKYLQRLLDMVHRSGMFLLVPVTDSQQLDISKIKSPTRLQLHEAIELWPHILSEKRSNIVISDLHPEA
ncbi:hypothetical protein AB1L30_05115 [Bremerella sp. JC817]|uniref:hypothetical protein n=1 Tax=Bremerella sp. JC817 TaxID=3231756 RepID=UPI00345A0EE2